MRSRRCAICGKDITKYFFCNDCYTTHKLDILAKKEWVKYLLREESKERRRYLP